MNMTPAVNVHLEEKVPQDERGHRGARQKVQLHHVQELLEGRKLNFGMDVIIVHMNFKVH
jgi:hypothetical protein